MKSLPKKSLPKKSLPKKSLPKASTCTSEHDEASCQHRPPDPRIPESLGGSASFTPSPPLFSSLEDARSHFLAVIETSEEAIVSLTLHGIVTSVNVAAERLFGFRASEIVGRPMSLLIPSDRQSEFDQQKEEACRGRGGGECKTVRQHKNGGLVPVTGKVVPVMNAEGHVIAVVTIARPDPAGARVGEQERDTLHRSEERFRSVFARAAVGVVLVDLQGRFLSANPAFCAVSGYTEAELLSLDFSAITYPEDRPASIAAVKKMLAGEIPSFVAEKRYIKKDTSIVWVQNSVSLVRDVRGNPEAVIALTEDITERKRAEDRLQKERDFISAVIDTVGSLVVVLDRHGCAVRFNTACERLTGYTSEMVKGKPIMDMLLPPEEAEAVRGVFAQLTAGQFPNSYENHWVTPDGRRLIAWSNTALLGPTGAVEYVIGTGIDITDRRRAEAENLRIAAALRESQQRLDRALAAGRMGTWDWDLITGTVHRSESLEALYGLAPGTLERRAWAYEQTVHPEDRDRVAATVRQSLETGNEHQVIYRVLRPDGKVRWVEGTGRVVRDERGMATRLSGTSQDVTERVEAEQALRERERQLRTVTDNVPVLIARVDRDYRYHFANRAYQDLLGIPPADVLGRTLVEVMGQAAFKAVKPFVVRAFAGDALTFEATLDYRTVGPRRMHISYVPEHGPGGVVSVVISAMDITELRKAEGALRDSEERFRQIAENTQEIFWMSDPKTSEILYVNQAYEAIWGRTCRSLYEEPRSFTDAVHPDDREGLMEALEGKLLTGGFDTEYRVVRPDGAVRWIWDRATPVRNEQGEVYRVVGIAQDITERKRAQEALRTSTDKLQALSRRLVDVQEAERREIARELHDQIGQILTGLSLTLDAGRRLTGERLRQNLAQADELARDAIARVRQLSLDLRPAMLDDLGLLPALLWHFQRLTAQTGVRVAFTHDGLQQRFPPEIEVAAYRIIQEALTNVARHASTGAARVRLWTEDATLHVRIEDHGIGFDRERVLASYTSSGLMGMQERVSLLGGRFA